MNLARIKSFRELPPRSQITNVFSVSEIALRGEGAAFPLLPHPFILRRKSAVLLDFALT